MKFFKVDMIAWVESDKFNIPEEMIKWLKDNNICIPSQVTEWTKNTDIITLQNCVIEYLKSKNIEMIEDFPRKWLKDNGIDIKGDFAYKKNNCYNEMKYEVICSFEDGAIFLENYIERYLLPNSTIIETYETDYDMGNIKEFTVYPINNKRDRINMHYDLAIQIVKFWQPQENESDLNDEVCRAENWMNILVSLTKRLNKYFKFDLKSKLFDLKSESLDDKHKEYKREAYKILYFFCEMEKRYPPEKNIMKLLANPSMENMCYHSPDRLTYNGKYIRKIKNALEKELSIKSFEIKSKIKDAVNDVTKKWDEFHKRNYEIIEHLRKNFVQYPFDEVTSLLNKIDSELFANKKVEYQHSPIETLYLKILQYEQIGKIDDTLWLSSIKINRNYCRNREFLNTLRKYHKIFVDVDDDEAVAKKVIEIAESKTAEYVYLKHNITQDDKKG